MDDATLRNQIGSNIAAYRKQAGLTQAGLAEKLNYSDKAVSKWERGESVPDVMTLVQLAELFQIPVGELLADPDALPGNPGTLEKAMTQVSEKALKRKANKNVISGAVVHAGVVHCAADIRHHVLVQGRGALQLACLFLRRTHQRHRDAEPAVGVARFPEKPTADFRHRVGIPDRHSCFRTADLPV